MQLCSESCEQGADFCHPLSTFQLRLNDQLVSDKRYIQRLATGSLVQSCAPRGPGVNFNRTELASLGRNNPANVRGALVHACVCVGHLPCLHFLVALPRLWSLMRARACVGGHVWALHAGVGLHVGQLLRWWRDEGGLLGCEEGGTWGFRRDMQGCARS